MRKKPDISIFYSLACINARIELAAKEHNWGTFIQPQPDNLKTHQLDNMQSYGKKPGYSTSMRNNPLHDSIIARIQSTQDQLQHYRCSAKYYSDCFNLLIQHTGAIHQIVEVGPHFGDLSCLFAGALQHMNAGLDLVDIDKSNLEYTYHKICQVFPESAARVRLFFGDLPLYVKNVMGLSPKMNLIHYQGSYNFNDVIRDIGSTFYARNNIFGTMIHNTHLRSIDMNQYAFVDAALYAIFGSGIQFLKLGEEANMDAPSDLSTHSPCYYTGSRIDGMYIPYSKNQFRYPHPETPLESFLYQPEQT